MKEEDINERRRYEWMGVWMEESMNEKSDKNSWAASRSGIKILNFLWRFFNLNQTYYTFAYIR